MPLGTPAREKYPISGLSFVPKQNGRPAFRDRRGQLGVSVSRQNQRFRPPHCPRPRSWRGRRRGLRGPSPSPGHAPGLAPQSWEGRTRRSPAQARARGSWEDEVTISGTGQGGALSFWPLGPLVLARGADGSQD